MKSKGTITKWDAVRGFGFIAPANAGRAVFVHIRDITFAGSRPRSGSSISYELTSDDKGRPRAQNAILTDGSSLSAPVLPALCVASLFFYALHLAIQSDLLPRILLWLYTVFSVLAFLNYGWDKLAARRDWQRTPENTLHLIDLACGWPGALLAQQLFRHKSSKRPFRFWFWVTVVINTAVLGYLLLPQGQWLVQILERTPL
jgi:uncharacterized membrane protein YsdA (DUF1294 family)/cold shock CspA family protein